MYKYEKELFYFKYGVLQWPSMIISAVLYALVIFRLRDGKQNDRKRQLTVAFLVLWSAWVVLSVPYAGYEIYKQFYWKFELRFDSVHSLTFLIAYHHCDCLRLF